MKHRKYLRKDIDMVITLLRKWKEDSNSDWFSLALTEARKIDQETPTSYSYLVEWINCQIYFVGASNKRIYESMKLINAEVVED